MLMSPYPADNTIVLGHFIEDLCKVFLFNEIMKFCCCLYCVCILPFSKGSFTKDVQKMRYRPNLIQNKDEKSFNLQC